MNVSSRHLDLGVQFKNGIKGHGEIKPTKYDASFNSLDDARGRIRPGDTLFGKTVISVSYDIDDIMTVEVEGGTRYMG